MDSLTRSRLWFSSPLSHCKSGVALLKPVALTGIGSIVYRKLKWDWSPTLRPQCSTVLRPGKKSRWHKYFCCTENTSSVKTWMSLVHFPMANRGLSALWLITGASPSASFLSALILQQTLYPSSPSPLTFNPCHCELRLPVYALDEGPYERRKPENTSYGEGACSLWQQDERLMTVSDRHTCTLPAPGLGRSSSGFILERLLCMGSPVLLTADSLVGLFCCRQGFFSPKRRQN